MHSNDFTQRVSAEPSAGEASAIMDALLVFVSATDAFLVTLGLDPDDVVGRPLEEIFPASGAALIRAVLQQIGPTDREVSLRDLECIAPGFLLLDAALGYAKHGGGFELRLIETAQTSLALQEVISSLFQPTDAHSPSLLWLSDVATGRVRTIRNNLSDRFGLGNCFSYEEFRAASHPDDIRTESAYLEERLRLSDDEFITFDQRMLTSTGEWHPVASRSRVFARGPDGLPCNMVGVLFDVGDYHRTTHALMKANAALIRAERTERENIGRNLHDSLSQHLVAARLTAQSLRTRELTDRAALDQLDELDAFIVAALAEVRGFSFLLHPPGLDELGLPEAVEQLCKGLSWRFGIPILFEVDPVIPRLDEEVEFALFRMVQEALLNVHRHAKANEVLVSYKQNDRMLELAVRDDGIGLGAVSPAAALPEGVGLSGMRARIAQAGGRLSIEDADPGLRLVASVALGPEA